MFVISEGFGEINLSGILLEVCLVLLENKLIYLFAEPLEFGLPLVLCAEIADSFDCVKIDLLHLLIPLNILKKSPVGLPKASETGLLLVLVVFGFRIKT